MTIVENERSAAAEAKIRIIDCDIHPSMNRLAHDLKPYLAARWRDHYEEFGGRVRAPLLAFQQYPRFGGAARGDAWPKNGAPGSDLALMQEQHLDAYDIEYGTLHPMRPDGASERNQELGAALCSATNDWQLAEWVARDGRLKASLQVPQEDAKASVAEIKRLGDNPGIAHIAMVPRGIEPVGRRRYWPIYEAAAALNLPISFHVGGIGASPPTGAGWPSFYIEDHHSIAETMQALLASLILEGVFERFPALKIVLIEGGFAWVPSFSWRIDKHWQRLAREVPHVTRPPSETIKTNVWYTTQPMEEPADPRALLDIIEWVGIDRLLFSTDYPHWDFDDPRYAFKVPLEAAEKRMIFRDNALGVYRFS